MKHYDRKIKLSTYWIRRERTDIDRVLERTDTRYWKGHNHSIMPARRGTGLTGGDAAHLLSRNQRLLDAISLFAQKI